MMRNIVVVLLTKWYMNNENEFRTAGRVTVTVAEKCVQIFFGKLKGRERLGDLGVSGIKNKFVCV